MAPKWKGVRKVPLTLELALQFRDMKSNRGERDIKSANVREQAHLLSVGQLMTLFWGKYYRDGEEKRGNGNHTSHLAVACMQATRGELDQKSLEFCTRHLFSRAGPYHTAADLPRLHDKQLTVVIEEVDTENDEDEILYFRRWDNRKSARTAGDEFNLWVRMRTDFDEMDSRRVRAALNGVIHAARGNPEAFGFDDAAEVTRLTRDSKGASLDIPQVRDAVLWIVATVPRPELYQKIAGAAVWAEVWAKFAPDTIDRADAVVEEFIERLDSEEQGAMRWWQALTWSRKSDTPESLIKRGRALLQRIAEEIGANGEAEDEDDEADNEDDAA
jgi:hypothetical protein